MRTIATLKTEIFEVRDCEFCIEELTVMVNDYMKAEGIYRQDIQEYRTDSYTEKASDGTDMYVFKATLSWWSHEDDYSDEEEACDCTCDCDGACENCENHDSENETVLDEQEAPVMA